MRLNHKFAILCGSYIKKKMTGGRGLHRTEVAFLLLTQRPWVLFSAFPSIFPLMLLRFIDDIAKSSGQRLDNVNRTHLVLASGKLVLQKYADSGQTSNTNTSKSIDSLIMFLFVLKLNMADL